MDYDALKEELYTMTVLKEEIKEERRFLLAIEGIDSNNNIQKGNLIYATHGSRLTAHDIELAKAEYCTGKYYISANKCMILSINEIDI